MFEIIYIFCLYRTHFQCSNKNTKPTNYSNNNNYNKKSLMFHFCYLNVHISLLRMVVTIVTIIRIVPENVNIVYIWIIFAAQTDNTEMER